MRRTVSLSTHQHGTWLTSLLKCKKKIEQGDIYWVTLTGAGSEQSGRRPCIVVSRLAVNNAGRTVIIVPMTTTTSSANQYYRILLPVAEIIKDPSCPSAIQTSVAKCDHARVLDKS